VLGVELDNIVVVPVPVEWLKPLLMILVQLLDLLLLQ
jgi:hypothetical protein